MKLNTTTLSIVFVCLVNLAFGQNFTSSGDGSWTTGSNWSGGTAAPVTSQNWGTITDNNNLSTAGNYDFEGAQLNIASGKTLTINGNFTISNGAAVNVSGTLYINGNASLSANLNILSEEK